MGQEYFHYNLPGKRLSLLGTGKSQIINTLKYYRDERGKNIEIPSEEEIQRIEDLTIPCEFPLLKPEHFITAEVRPGIRFDVNANAFEYIQTLANSYEKLKRGDLFKFEPGVPDLGLWFLPEYVMQGLREYDWSQHAKQIARWLKEIEFVEGGALARPKDLIKRVTIRKVPDSLHQ